MYFPLTVPFSDTGEHHGIINLLNKIYGVDLLAEKYVELSSSTYYTGNIETLVNHGTGFYQSKSDGSSIYMQVSFLKGYIFPTGYTLKGANVDRHFSSSWYVYGIHEEDEDNGEKWELLGENDTSQSTYCRQTLYSGQSCLDESVGSFSLKPMRSSLGFKHLRWKTKASPSDTPAFVTAGIDVYGTLSLSKVKMRRNGKSFCRCRNSQNYLFLIVLFGNFISP